MGKKAACKSKFAIKWLPLDKIIPYARNPRKNEAGVAKTAGSLKEFGWKQPIVVDSDGIIIAGHTRLLAAQKLGMTEAPVLVADDLTPAQGKAYRIADNRVAEETDWDRELLRLELQELNLDTDFIGFDLNEIQWIMAEDKSGHTDPDALPGSPEALTKVGDIWTLGAHRIMCGDSTSAEDVAGLLDGTKPHLMVTDPPYGVEYDASWRSEAAKRSLKAKGTFGSAARAEGKVENDDRADWGTVWALFPGSVAYIWHAGTKADVVADSLRRAGFGVRAQIIWAKTRFVIGRGHYHVQHEPCWYAVRDTGSWQGSRKQSTLWSIEHLKSDTGHSTQKPVECMKRPIENNSASGQTVYDPFVGSGTTIIAAEITGRGCYAMEISPEYVDLAVKRWQEFTQEAPQLNGRKAA